MAHVTIIIRIQISHVADADIGSCHRDRHSRRGCHRNYDYTLVCVIVGQDDSRNMTHTLRHTN